MEWLRLSWVYVPLIHLHLKKLVDCSHVRLHALLNRHVICALVEGVGPLSMSAQPQCVSQAVRSPITEAWANQNLCTTNVTPFNEYNCPGLRMCDLFTDQLTCKFSSVGGKTKEEHTKVLKARRKVLNIAFTAVLFSPDSVTLVCDASVSLAFSPPPGCCCLEYLKGEGVHHPGLAGCWAGHL